MTWVHNAHTLLALRCANPTMLRVTSRELAYPHLHQKYGNSNNYLQKIGHSICKLPNMSNTGIGATIVPSAAGGFEISSLTPNGTARLHLQVGDRIMSIGSVATSGKTDEEVKSLIIGPAGSTISMVITRAHDLHAHKHILLNQHHRPSCAGHRPWPHQQANILHPEPCSSHRTHPR
jgi:hypothetical protein